MFRNFLRSVGFMLLSNSLFFSHIEASAASGSNIDAGSAVTGGLIGLIPGGLITAVVLVSKSRTKFKAVKAEKYVNSKLQLHSQDDVYLRTTTSKTKINSN